MMFFQDNFYKNIEADSFFNRNKASWSNLNTLRDSKKEILNLLKKRINLKNKKILEIGCFIGDLLFYLKKKYKCKVHGVEPSSLACKYAKKKFSINIENSTFASSKFFSISLKNHKKFDLIIIDDVFSWIDRSLILQTVCVIDWILKDNGYIFIRDFSPKSSFAVKNRHSKKKKIYNFKLKDGHKNFFLKTGKYKILYNRKYFTKKFNKAISVNRQSNIWSDTIIKKINKFTYPIKKL